MNNTNTPTNRSYVRTTGRNPRGTGAWAFQASRTEVAFDADLFGEVVFANGTLTEARRQAATVLSGPFLATLG